MSVELFTELEELIDKAEHPVLAILVAAGCEKYKGQFLTNMEEQINKQTNPLHVHTICYKEDVMEFPHPMTQVVYYFAPKNYTPLFYRQGARAYNVADDVLAAMRMIQGSSYIDAAYENNPELKIQYTETEHMVNSEDTSKFPSLFQQARNFAKEIWHTGKNSVQGLPILVDVDTAFKRFETCQGCEFLKTDQFRCEKCGCFMKTKTQLASASCPIEKWSAITLQK